MSARTLGGGLVGALVAKLAFEVLLTAGYDRPLFHCSAFVDNQHCSFIEWVFNPGDLVVMIPGFVIGMALAAWSRRDAR